MKALLALLVVGVLLAIQIGVFLGLLFLAVKVVALAL